MMKNFKKTKEKITSIFKKLNTIGIFIGKNNKKHVNRNKYKIFICS